MELLLFFIHSISIPSETFFLPLSKKIHQQPTKHKRHFEGKGKKEILTAEATQKKLFFLKTLRFFFFCNPFSIEKWENERMRREKGRKILWKTRHKREKIFTWECFLMHVSSERMIKEMKKMAFNGIICQDMFNHKLKFTLTLKSFKVFFWNWNFHGIFLFI